MPVHIADIMPMDGFVEVSLSGMADGSTDFDAAVAKINAALEEAGRLAVLMDCRRVHYPSTKKPGGRFAGDVVAQNLARFSQAWLVSDGVEQRAFRDMETVARNDGARLRIFRERDAAESWLLRSLSAAPVCSSQQT